MFRIKKICFHIKILSFIFTLLLLFFLSDLVHSNVKYYYLHVGSFQTVKKATQFAQNLQKMGLETVVRGEKIVKRGLWYRIYVGPLFSRLEAKLESRELKAKGITDYVGIHKKESLLLSNLEKKPELIEKSAKDLSEKAISKITPPPTVAPLVSKPPPTIEKKLPTTKPHPVKVPPKKEKMAVEKTPPKSKTRPSKKIRPKTFPKTITKGYGRNTRQGGVTLCIKHTYRDIQTEVTERKTFGGLPTTYNKHDFPTSMHMTILRLHYGLTDYFEIFADAGSAFNEPSEPGFAYGGGVRFNLFIIRSKISKEFYAALQGEYLGGEFEEEYKSDAGNTWEKETDWQESTGRIELGIASSKFTAYLGGIYFVYSEDTERRLTTTDRYQDDLEGKNDFGAYGGVAIHLTPALIVNLEGQALIEESICLALKYQF